MAEVSFELEEKLTSKMAIKLLGLEVLDSNSRKTPTCKLKMYDAESGKLKTVPVFMALNDKNRPFSVSLANRYANEMLRREWRLNGETLIFDQNAKPISAQHRCGGVILAEQMRLAGVELAVKYNWKSPVYFPTFIVYGISPKAADSTDQGKSRSGTDVIFQSREFKSGYDPKEQKRLSKVLAGAARLAWIRMGGKNVSDAPKFMTSEMLNFIKAHPYLKECAMKVMELDGLDETDKPLRQIDSLLSLAYAAALMFLFAHTKTKKNGEPTFQKEAELFWYNFANEIGEKDAPQTILRHWYNRSFTSGTRDRNTLVGVAVNAWVASLGGLELTARSIKPKRGADPRCGGYDQVIEPEIEEPVEEPITEPTDKPKPRRRRRKAADDAGTTSTTTEGNSETPPQPRRRRRRRSTSEQGSGAAAPTETSEEAATEQESGIETPVEVG